MPGDGKENARLPETFSGCWVRVYTTGKKASPGFPTEKHSSLFDAGALSTIGMMLSISLRNSPEGILSVRPRRTLIPARGSRRDFSGLQGYTSENPVPMRSRAMPTGCQLRNLTAWRCCRASRGAAGNRAHGRRRHQRFFGAFRVGCGVTLRDGAGSGACAAGGLSA